MITRQSTFYSFFYYLANATATIADPCIRLSPFEETSPLTMYTSTALGVSLKSPRALAFPGWSTFLTSTLRQPRRPSSIVPRQLVRPRSARHSPLPRSFDRVRCSDMRTSSLRICQVCTHHAPPPPFLGASLRVIPSSNPTTSVVNMVAAQPWPNQSSPSTCTLQ